jgi:class 3 adenylate cyclase
MRVASFVPDIIRSLDREKPWHEWRSGAVLFADISGFTPMSEALASLGAEGAEILTDKLNRYFARMIRSIHDHEGEVMKFGGDALLCLFPDAKQAQAAAREMQQQMAKFHHIKTPAGKFALQMKIGIASGPVLLGALGDDRCSRSLHRRRDRRFCD